MYKVICPFTDLKDNRYAYRLGDVYPRAGAAPTKKRISELLSDTNIQHKPLIEEITETSSNNDADIKPPRRKRGKKNASD